MVMDIANCERIDTSGNMELLLGRWTSVMSKAGTAFVMVVLLYSDFEEVAALVNSDSDHMKGTHQFCNISVMLFLHFINRSGVV